MILLTDSNSRIPVTIQPSGQNALMVGDNSAVPLLDFIESPGKVRAGDRIVSSGDGGLFPPGLLVGHVLQGPDRRFRVRLAADYERLEFLRVLRSHAPERIVDPGALIAPEPRPNPLPPEAAAPAGSDAGPEGATGATENGQ